MLAANYVKQARPLDHIQHSGKSGERQGARRTARAAWGILQLAHFLTAVALTRFYISWSKFTELHSKTTACKF